jgi:predicted transcriptional regulator
MTETTEVEVLPAKQRNKGGRPKGRKNSREVIQVKKTAKVLELRARGLSQSEIAGAVGLSETRVKQLVQQFKPVFSELENIEAYQSVRKDLLSATELVLLKSLNDPEKLSKASANGIAYSFSQIFQARRLETGQSTQNVQQSVVAISLTPGEYSEPG